MFTLILKLLSLSIISVYTVVCTYFYFNQEKLIFKPAVLAKDFVFKFKRDFVEKTFKVENGEIHGLFFPKENSKGLIFYCHGNAGSMESWGVHAEDFKAYDYDLLMFDYRGYGKSPGQVGSEDEFLGDSETIFKEMLKSYKKENIIIYGRSLGTGVASYLASKYHVKYLVLETPYFSFESMMGNHYPFLPKFLLRFPLRQESFISKIKSPIHMFHGTEDETIPYSEATKLHQKYPEKLKFTTIPGGLHNNLNDFEAFRSPIHEILK